MAAFCTAYALYTVAHVGIRMLVLNVNSFVSETVGAERKTINCAENGAERALCRVS
jgi:hypothetical protein